MILRPYAALLLDGWGAANGKTIDDVAGLTPHQVKAWYVEPMLKAQRASERGEAATGTPPVPAKPAGRPMRFADIGQFRDAFARWHADKPDEWWEEKWQKWKRQEESE